MSAKIAKKSRVSVNDMSSEDDIDSDLGENQINDEFDDNNNVEESDDNELDEDMVGNPANSGWADAISKVLAVKTKKKSLILSKAKKDKDMKRKGDEQQTDSLEIVKSDGTLVKSSDKNKKLKTNESIPKKKNKLSKNEWEVMHKQKPKEEDKERERRLCSIATKGVVQLFNAVREQQKTIETKIKEVGVSETKRDKMLSHFNKNQFLDKLKQTDNKPNKSKNSKTETEEKGEHKWKVLRDDFMIGAKMKDWDKESDSDQESND